MTESHVLSTSSWTAITSAGENATAWLSSGEFSVIDHSKIGGGDCDASKAYRCYSPKDNTDVVNLVADDSTDVFYALGRTAGCVVTVDII